MERLQENRLVKVSSDYYFLYAKNWVKIDKNILSNLVRRAKTKEEHIDLLRTFLILKKIDKIAEKAEERSFTIRQISILLGHGDTTAKYYESIRIYLATLSFWGLIELKQHRQYNESLGASYTIFHLQKTKEVDLAADFYSNQNAEMEAFIQSEEFMNKLRFTFPNIIGD